MNPVWLQRNASGQLLLQLHVQPGASKTGIAGTYGDALKIRLAAPPVDGKANDCLLGYVSGKLGIARASVELVSGAGARRKRLRLSGVAAEAVVRAFSNVD